jgi:tRNA modification GTPase
MHRFEDVIVAVSSASASAGHAARSIVRLSGAGVWGALEGVVDLASGPSANAVVPCRVRVSERVALDAMAYCFLSPRSYTGEDMAEVHVWAAADAVGRVLERLCERVRLAGPGEFTLRAYLNGKMDLTQAEAVAQIVSSANVIQLAAAEKLLHGRFSETIGRVRAEVLEVLSLIEAGLDFTEEDISFISSEQAAGRITAQKKTLRELLEGSVRLERMIDLDAAGLAGLPNAGKSSLVNALLGRQRSIVSPIAATTRDILTGVLELGGTSCVLFDCAGMLPDGGQRDAVDGMAHQAAAEALERASLALFCMDAGKTSFEAELRILSKIKSAVIIPVATKADLSDAAGLLRLERLAEKHFSVPLCITSTKTGRGLAELKSRIESALISGRGGEERADRLTLNRRHEERIGEAVKILDEAADEMMAGREETAAMLLRQGYETLGGLERENVSEKILGSIFSRFCIGK